MRKVLVAAAAIALSAAVGRAQDKNSTAAKLDAATVFYYGAELTHSARMNLAGGENTVYIGNLSPEIDRNSLKITSPDGVIVTMSEFSVDYLADSPAATVRLKNVEDSIAMYQANADKIDSDIKINADLLEFLRSGTGRNVSGGDKGATVEEMTRAMDYYKTRSGELEAARVALEKRRGEIQAALDRLRRQFNQESIKGNKTSGMFKLTLSSPRAMSADFTISYFTHAAKWQPFYDVNVSGTDKPMAITSRCKVQQTTGLDWENVRLTLSTVERSGGKRAPLFSAWFLVDRTEDVMRYGGSYTGEEVQNSLRQNSYSYIDELQEDKEGKPVASKREPVYMVNGEVVSREYAFSLDQSSIRSRVDLKPRDAVAKYGEGGADGVVEITLYSSMDNYVNRADNALNVVYNIDRLYAVPGNGKEQVIDLQTKAVPSEYKFYSAPKLDAETYLVAEIADWQQLGLLNGKVNITYEGTYAGESMINVSSTQEKLALTLGADRRVVVKREKMQDFSSTKTLGSSTVQTFTYRITVRNNQSRAIDMVVKDQYPISTRKDIEVTLLKENTTPWTVNKEDVGVVTWEEKLAPGETKTYQLSYSVKYPKGMYLNL